MQSESDTQLATLLDAYLAADYRWQRDRDWHVLEIGHRATELEAAFPLVEHFSLITAWNPWSRPVPDAINRAADQRLQRALKAGGWWLQPAFATASNQAWREPGWLVLDLPITMHDALARRFKQLGTLRWQRRTPVRLRMHSKPPAASAAYDHVDWVK